MKGPYASGFTLVELMVAIAIVAILAALAASAYEKVEADGKEMKEMSAARTLIAAYISAATDQDGVCLRGYDQTIGQLALPDGVTVTGVVAQRYPHRLAQYFSFQYEGTILVNDNASQIDPANTYFVSLFPALGMNCYFVGGYVEPNGTLIYPQDCISRASQAAYSPLVFASAAYNADGELYRGFYLLTPPYLTSQMWSSQEPSAASDPGLYGNVDGRYGGKAVCAFLDGSVRMLSIDELRDMRLWDVNAAKQDNPNYCISQ